MSTNTQIDNFIDSLNEVTWFAHAGNASKRAVVAKDLSDAWDGYRRRWNAKSVEYFAKQSIRLEAEAQSEFGDDVIDDIFARVGSDVGPTIWDALGEYLERNGDETGVESAIAIDLFPAVQRDLAWAFVEQMLGQKGCYGDALTWYKRGRRLFGWVKGLPPKGEPFIL